MVGRSLVFVAWAQSHLRTSVERNLVLSVTWATALEETAQRATWLGMWC
jgi:hypothetical protein